MKWLYYIKRFREIPGIEKKMLIQGSLLSIWVMPLIKCLPVKYYVSLFKSQPKKSLPQNKISWAIRIARKTMNRLSFIIPFNNSCLIKSTIFKLLLNSLGVKSNLSLGLNKKGPSQLEAHAYVKINDEIVFLRKNRYHELITF